jgi:hypothetical protein
MAEPEILQERRTVDSSLILPLDPSLLTLSAGEKDFLSAAISSDEEEFLCKINSIQEE